VSGFREVIFSKAFTVVPGVEYNRTLGELRGRRGEKTLFYEAVMPEETAWEGVRDKIYPRFVRYLKNKSIDPEAAPGVVVSLFFRDRCYIMEGRDFIEALREIEGLDGGALHFRVLRWLAEEGA
jgi:hypothetical protein